MSTFFYYIIFKIYSAHNVSRPRSPHILVLVKILSFLKAKSFLICLISIISILFIAFLKSCLSFFLYIAAENYLILIFFVF